MTRSDLIEARVAKLISGFGDYVQTYDDSVPFTGQQLALHRKTIALRREAGSVRAAVEDEQYVASLRQTLQAWSIGRRASRLVSEEEFVAALRAVVPRLEPLELLTIDATDLPGDLADQFWFAIESLGVVTNKAKLVAGTKTLHHLLPDLVPPMDRAWTGTFFQFHLPEWQDLGSQRRVFRIAYNQFVTVAQRARPEQYVTGLGWRTSRTKILDNALIGFCKVELGSQPVVVEDATNEILFEVAEYPPAKDGATSIFAAEHGHLPRVRLLLERAQQAYEPHGFTQIEMGPVALDVVLYSPAGRSRSDATNYLGGIADVLECKAHRGPLDHLGELANVWLYGNDRQIKEVTYREVRADTVSYTVRVRELGEHR